MEFRLNRDIIHIIFGFLHPTEYMFVNKTFYRRVLNQRRNAVQKISKWYSKVKVHEPIEIITPKIFLVRFNNFWISSMLKNRKKSPEYIAPLLNLNLYSLKSLPEKNKRTIQDILLWLRNQNLSQYEYQCLKINV